MTSRSDSGPPAHRAAERLTVLRAIKLVNCGIMSGLAQAVMFNPWDRALYLSVKNDVPFLSSSNFSRPMAGVVQTVAHRALSAGLYFPLEEIYGRVLSTSPPSHHHRNPYMTLIAGTLAGVTNGIVLNPFARIKYQSWGQPDHLPINFVAVSIEILRVGGVRQLFVGSMATIYRDLVFGGCFALMRHELLPMVRERSLRRAHTNLSQAQHMEERNRERFAINLLAATMATLLSAPFNYVRNMHYATPPDCQPHSTARILSDLLRAALAEDTVLKKWYYLQSRLRLGWGTARVGCGMAFGAFVYDFCLGRVHVSGHADEGLAGCKTEATHGC